MLFVQVLAHFTLVHSCPRMAASGAQAIECGFRVFSSRIDRLYVRHYVRLLGGVITGFLVHHYPHAQVRLGKGQSVQQGAPFLWAHVSRIRMTIRTIGAREFAMRLAEGLARRFCASMSQLHPAMRRWAALCPARGSEVHVAWPIIYHKKLN
jgi:hypothetical protein